MRRLFIVLGYLAILVWAYRVTASLSGFFLTGSGLVLLLDKYLFQLLRWPPLAWRRELAMRGGSFLLGAALFYLVRPGSVPPQEAIYRGFMVCLAGMLLERVGGTLGRPRWAALLVLIGVLVPW